MTQPIPELVEALKQADDAHSKATREIVCRALRLCDGYVLRAAGALAWHRTTLLRFLEAHPDLARHADRLRKATGWAWGHPPRPIP